MRVSVSTTKPQVRLHLAEPPLSDEEDDIGLISITTPFTPRVIKHSLLTPQDAITPLSGGKLNSQILSPSSPDLLDPVLFSPRSLNRSKTVPDLSTLGSNSKLGDQTLENLVLEPERVALLRRWILALVIVDFDLELGPVISNIYPSLKLSHVEEENIAFSSFPDSAQFDQGSQTHSFRIREVGHGVDELVRPDEARPYSVDGFIYGFSHFTQRKDTSSKRGYQQRSLVLLSRLPYPILFTNVMSKIGPAFQAHGGPMLEVACHNIANWPDPVFGTTVELGFLGSVFQVELPVGLDEYQMPQTTSVPLAETGQYLHMLATMPPQHLPPVSLFEASLSHLWSIWECLVLCEPLLIFGSSPAMTSQAVWWLRDFLRPMPIAGDFRPYFTIHDKDHASLINQKVPQAGILLGVTNPFYETTCKHWPHILSVGSQMRHSSLGHSSPVPVPVAGWNTKTHKRYISKDRVLLKMLQHVCHKNQDSQLDVAMLLRRHFTSRTTEFLVPLNRYLNTLIPAPTSVPKQQNAPHQKLKPFNKVNFFESLKVHGSPLPFKSTTKQKEFYERWLRCPGFGLWLAKQEEIVDGVLNGAATGR